MTHPKVLVGKLLKEATHNYKDRNCHAEEKATSWTYGKGKKKWGKFFVVTYEDGTSEKVSKAKFLKKAHELYIPMPAAKKTLAKMRKM